MVEFFSSCVRLCENGDEHMPLRFSQVRQVLIIKEVEVLWNEMRNITCNDISF